MEQVTKRADYFLVSRRPGEPITIDGFTFDELRMAHEAADGAEHTVRELSKLPPDLLARGPFKKAIDAAQKVIDLRAYELPSLRVVDEAEARAETDFTPGCASFMFTVARD